MTYNAIQGLVFARELPISDRSDTNFPAINFQSLASGNAGRLNNQKLMHSSYRECPLSKRTKSKYRQSEGREKISEKAMQTLCSPHRHKMDNNVQFNQAFRGVLAVTGGKLQI